MAKKSNRTKPATKEEEPPAPWGSFPLVELTVLAGLVLIIIGAITGNPTQLVIGLALGSLAGLELSTREHFAGYRSHTTLLAGVVFVLSTGAAFFSGKVVLWVAIVIGVVFGGVAWGLLRRAFVKASGGLTYKLR